jgi:hypothetical protein
VTHDLCEYEVKVLRLCAGEPVPDIEWGAAMGQSLECLRGAGLVSLSAAGVYSATELGRGYLVGRATRGAP